MHFHRKHTAYYMVIHFHNYPTMLSHITQGIAYIVTMAMPDQSMYRLISLAGISTVYREILSRGEFTPHAVT